MIIGKVNACQKSDVLVENKTRSAEVVNLTLEGANSFLIYLCAWEENVSKVIRIAKQDNVCSIIV